MEYSQPFIFSHGAAYIKNVSMLFELKWLFNFLMRDGIFTLIFLLFLMILLVSLILLLFEKKGHFEGDRLKNLGSALWFSATTITGVAYGDTRKLTMIGRAITFFWMLTGLLFVALFTGNVVSAISAQRDLSMQISREDLSNYRVGLYAGSHFDNWTRLHGIPATRFASPNESLEALNRGQITADVGDYLVLNYEEVRDYPGSFRVSVIKDSRVIYGFGLRPGFPLAAEINKKILEITLASDWKERTERWTGPLAY
jgi:ABC-type amino acid transport substrate-binding protein